jgi:ribonuclease E
MAAPVEAAAAPKRRASTRAKAATPGADVAPVAADAGADVAPAAPKRRTTTRKKAEPA